MKKGFKLNYSSRQRKRSSDSSSLPSPTESEIEQKRKRVLKHTFKLYGEEPKFLQSDFIKNTIEKIKILKSKRQKTIPKVTCKKCWRPFSKANIAKHRRTCKGGEDNIAEEKAKLILENEQLKKENDLLRQENETLKLQMKNDHPDYMDIKQLTVAKKLNTRISYIRHWGQYEKWCLANQSPINSISSLAAYFNSLSNVGGEGKIIAYSTKKTIRSILASTFKAMYEKDPSRFLKIKRQRGPAAKVKYSMSDNEVLSYLSTFQGMNQDFLANYILLMSGARVHSLAVLKVKECSVDGVLSMHDHKTTKDIPFQIPVYNFRLMLQDLIAGRQSEDFVFYPCRSHKNFKSEEHMVNTRSNYVGKIIKKQILKSTIFDRVEKAKFVLSAHCHRKAQANLSFQGFIKKGLEVARKGINQASGSSAILHYVDLPSTNEIFEDLSLKLEKIFFPEIDERVQNLFNTNFD